MTHKLNANVELLQPLQVQASSEAAFERAGSIATALQLPLLPVASDTQAERNNAGWLLQVSPCTLQIVRPDGVSAGIDFTSSESRRRVSEPGLARQPLARAIGLSRSRRENLPPPTVLDATAGYGQDGWLIATLGCQVSMLERSSLLHLMLAAALEQARHKHETANTAARIRVECADAGNWLQTAVAPVAETIYLDPMYPPRRKRALVKKHLQILHELLGPDHSNQTILSRALAAAGSRVVVKRPKGAERLAGSDLWRGQTSSIESAGTRYDIYHTATAC